MWWNRRLVSEILCLFFLVLYVAPIAAQDTFEEKLLEEQEDSSEQSELLEIIAELRKEPLNLNEASRQQLKAIPGIPLDLVDTILNYRAEKGRINRKEELRVLPGMDELTYSYLSEVTTVTQFPASTLRSELSWRSRYLDRIDKPIGFKNGVYESGPAKVYNRAQFSWRGQIEGGLLLEKDSGESRFDDLRLFYLATQLGETLEITVGNYQLLFGQGLVFWGPYGFSKSSDAIYPVRRHGRGARGYLTVDENAALSGITATVRRARIDVTLFASRSSLDASPISGNDVVGLFASGFHRNANEESKRDVLDETVLGGHAQYAVSDNLALGATFYASSFSKNFQDPDFERSRFEFRGKRNHVAGFDWRYASELVSFFGEAARSRNGGTAVVAGTQLDLRSVALAMLFRDYKKEFQNFHGFGFGERNGESQNERGFYLGLAYRPLRTTRFHAYYDVYTFPWRTFFEPLPVQGNDFMARLEQQLSRDMLVTVRFREKSRHENQPFQDDFGREIRQMVERRQRQLRLQLELQATRELRLRGRIDITRTLWHGFGRDLSADNETGFLVYQDIRFRPSEKFGITARVTFFDTDSFDSRVFQYENDLPGVATNRALFGRGTRWYLLLKYRPFKRMSLHLKYSESLRDDVDTTGTGPDRIDGNLDRRLGLQMEVALK